MNTELVKKIYNIEFNFQKELSTNDPIELWLPLPENKNDFQEVQQFSYEHNANQIQYFLQPEYNFPYAYFKWEPSRNKKIMPDSIAGAKINNNTLNNQAFCKLNWKIELTEQNYNIITHPQSINTQLISSSVRPSEDELKFYLLPRPHVPTDGIVLERANQITHGLTDTLNKAWAIYKWVTQHGQRDPNQIGCGIGNVKESLLDNHICGRCVDISSVTTALLRAANIPARELFGLRVGDHPFNSKLGKVGLVSESQHCKIQFWSNHKGWVTIDPGDVLSVALNENLSLSDSRFTDCQKYFFGNSYPQWIYFNSGRDFSLAPSTGQNENYLMYPLGQIFDQRLNSYNPNDFSYSYFSNQLNF